MKQSILATSKRLFFRSFPMALTLAVALALPRVGSATEAPDGTVDVWISSNDRTRLLDHATVELRSDGTAKPVQIDVDLRQRYQQIVGFGAALTDASAWLIQNRLSPTQRAALLQELFGREDGGLGLSFTRLTIGASDFSRHHYSLDDPPDGKPDPQLAHFSLGPNRADVVPVAKAALAVNPGLKIMASPWSAPAWMKDNRSLIQGRLDPAHYDAFARYLLRYVDAMAAEGVPIFALTVQNEPDFEPKDYPGMRLNAPARARLIGDHLGPLLASRTSAPLLFDWDHNWDKPQEPLAVLADPAASRYVDAVAWHCYGGDVSAQTPVHEAYPDKDVYLTECSGGDWEPLRSGGMVMQARQLIVLSPRHWARGVLFWNLALDDKRGPHAGGCDTCRGVVTIDSATGAVSRTEEYYALAHASRFVRPGAYRIASTPTANSVDNVAFQNPDDGSIVLIVTNSATKARSVTVGEAGRRFQYRLPAKSLATFVWKAAGPRSE